MIYHCDLTADCWKKESCPPFTELMISWNGARPTKGNFLIYVSVEVGEWSPWLLYASWGAEGQKSCSETGQFAKVYQDAFEILDGKKATGFEIQVVAEGGASLAGLHQIHVYTNGNAPVRSTSSCINPVYLKVNGLSQQQLTHERCRDLCSPTSTTAVVRYLSKRDNIDPIHFAASVWDEKFDIFGNWVLNVAEASNQLGPSWSCWVEKLSGFDQLYSHLLQETPVIVSVRGPLINSATPYARGHLLVVIGFNPEKGEVICMDPAFPTDEKTHVRYPLADFLQAWERRGNLAYLFSLK